MPSRREFVSMAAFAGAAVLVSAQTPQAAPTAQPAAPPKPPALDRDIVIAT
jgi:hypothetical protein